MFPKTLIFTGVLLCAAGAFAQSNPIEGGRAVAINDIWNLGSAELGVGTGSSGNSLFITNNGLVAAESALIGGTAAGDDNLVSISLGGELYLTNGLVLGNSGSENRLELLNGELYSASGTLGNQAASGGNRVVIAGTNGFWGVDETLVIGEAGDANSVLVRDEGFLGATKVVLGQTAASGSNTLAVADGGLFLADALVVGAAGSGNQAVFTNGASLLVLDTTVGAADTALDNTAWASGSNTVWLNYGTLSIGTASNSGNSVTITNGAVLILREELKIAGTNNQFNLADGGFFAIETNFNASMQGFIFNEGGTLGVGGTLTGMTNRWKTAAPCC